MVTGTSLVVILCCGLALFVMMCVACNVLTIYGCFSLMIELGIVVLSTKHFERPFEFFASKQGRDWSTRSGASSTVGHKPTFFVCFCRGLLRTFLELGDVWAAVLVS